jgi:hypothetical protein
MNQIEWTLLRDIQTQFTRRRNYRGLYAVVNINSDAHVTPEQQLLRPLCAASFTSKLESFPTIRIGAMRKAKNIIFYMIFK